MGKVTIFDSINCKSSQEKCFSSSYCCHAARSYFLRGTIRHCQVEPKNKRDGIGPSHLNTITECAFLSIINRNFSFHAYG